MFSAFWPLSYCRNCWLLLCTPQAIWHLHRWLGLEELTLYRIVRLQFSSQGSKAWTLSSHNLGKDLAGFVSGVGCQVFHEISGFWVLDACITGSVIVWLPRNWICILKCSAKASTATCTWPFNTLPPLIGLPGSMFGIHVPLVTQLGTTPVAWYNLHFGLMVVKVNFFFLYKKWKKP